MKWRIGGWDTFSQEAYSLEGEWKTEEGAQEAALDRLRELERTQPTVSSGGQAASGIQDRVFVIRPDGSEYRMFPTPDTYS